MATHGAVSRRGRLPRRTARVLGWSMILALVVALTQISVTCSSSTSTSAFIWVRRGEDALSVYRERAGSELVGLRRVAESNSDGIMYCTRKPACDSWLGMVMSQLRGERVGERLWIAVASGPEDEAGWRRYRLYRDGWPQGSTIDAGTSGHWVLGGRGTGRPVDLVLDDRGTFTLGSMRGHWRRHREVLILARDSCGLEFVGGAVVDPGESTLTTGLGKHAVKLR